ncbi:MAG: formylglycine-generating enzyme family protein [Chloroflexi bacterium]|nr:formylglycine-generating enzyme family protein [Chloroflexota bacterium]
MIVSVHARRIRPSVFAVAAVVLGAIMAAATTSAVAWWNHRPPAPSHIAWLRQHAPPGMVLVPAGWFWMGSDSENADPGSQGKHRVWVPSFYIDRYPVTNREYALFDKEHHCGAGQGQFPVTGVTWSQAAAYLRAKGEVLPTEAEWEKAARGPDGREFPWGNDPGHWLDSTVRHRSFTAVDQYREPASPYGVRDMAGTVWQWARDNVQQDASRQIVRGGARGYSPVNDTTYSRGIEGAGVT